MTRSKTFAFKDNYKQDDAIEGITHPKVATRHHHRFILSVT